MKKKFIYISFAFLLLVTVITGSFFYYYSRPSTPINEKIKVTSFVAPIAPNAKIVLKAQLEERRTNLLALAKSDPAKFKQSVLSSEDRKTIPSDLQYLVENPIEVSGELFVAQGDNKSTQSAINIFWLKEGSKTYNLNFIEKPETIKSAELVTARGVALDREIVLDNPASPNLVVRSEYRPLVTGDQKTLVIYHDFSNATIDPLITKTNVEKEMTTNANSVANFYPENSYGNVTITTTVTNKLTSAYSTDGTCHDPDIEAIITNAYTAAAAYNPDTYDRLIYLFPRITACSWAGLGQVGGINPATPTTAWINGYNESWIYSHELGHNLGAWTHAGFLDCGALAIDTISNCTNTEYGDLHDTMGWGSGHFNAAIKEGFEWLAEGNGIQTVTASGTYTINALENNTGTRALKVAKPDQPGKYYFFEFRKSIGYTGYDSGLPAGVTDGVIAHIGTDQSANTSLIDFRPDGSKVYNLAGDAENVSLTDGVEYYDQINNIKVTQTSHSASLANISINFENAAPNLLRVSTSLTLSNNTPAIGELVKATASVQNTSSAPITLQYLGIVNYFGSYARNFGGGAITLNPGQIVSLTDYPERTLPDLGSYKAWVCFAYADRWYTVTPASGKISEITYNTHIPDIRIVGYIDLNPASPVAGQSVTATASIRNMEAKSIKLDAVAIANILNYPQQNYRSFGGETMTIPAGEARLLQYSRTLTETGTYRASIAFATGNYWFEVPWSGKMYVVNHPLSVLRVSTSLTLSNNTPAIGELVKATASVQNTSSAPITLQYLGIVNYFGSYARNFGGGAITLNPGQIVSLTDYPERTLPDLGSYKAWVCFAYADRWYTVTPASGKISEITYNTHIPDIRIVGYIDLNPASPVAGQSVTATASIRNMEARNISLDYLGIVNQFTPPSQNYINYGGSPMIVGPGEARLLKYTQTLTSIGDYRTWIAFATGNYWFSANNSFKYYQVR